MQRTGMTPLWTVVVLVLFLVLGTVVIWQSAANSLLPPQGLRESTGGGSGRTNGQISFPGELEGLPLAGDILAGEAALEDINRLHGSEIPLLDGYIATYQKGEEMVKIWVSVAESPEKAGELAAVMTEKMAGSQVFTPPEKFLVKGMELYVTTGMGMMHYYYAKGDRVYWLSIAANNEMGILWRVVHDF